MTERLFLGVLTPSEVLALLTLVLVIVTAYYAWQTRGTVQEMRRARGVAVLPRLTVGIKTVGAGNGWPQISNVGPGPAIDVDVRIGYAPDGPDVGWKFHVLASGESREFFTPKTTDPNQVMYRVDELVAAYSHITLKGTCRDALGAIHTVDELVEIRDWWRVIQGAHVRLHRDPAEEAVKELEKLRRPLESMAGDLKSIRQRDEPDMWVWESRLRRLPQRLQSPARRLLRRLALL